MKLKLCNLVNIVENNKNCVVLKIKDNAKLDLIRLGYFNGNEDIIRLTKGKNHTCTIIEKDSKNYNWQWGDGGYTLVSDEMNQKGKLIEQCIVEDFDIYIGSNEKLINDSLHIRDLDDSLNAIHHIEIMYFNPDNVIVHKEHEFYKSFSSENDAIKHFNNLGYTEYLTEEGFSSQTGCVIKRYEIERNIENDYCDNVTSVKDLNNHDSFTVARVVDNKRCAELHYDNGKATVEYGTEILPGQWDNEIVDADWFSLEMSDEEVINRLNELFKINFEDYYEM